MEFKDLSNITIIKENKVDYYLLQTNLINETLSYEIFLIDMINQSKYFKSKSGGNLFRMPLSESNGECDAVSKNYNIDFKLLVNNKTMKYLNKIKDKRDYSKLGEGYIFVKTNDAKKLVEEKTTFLTKLSEFNLSRNNSDLKHVLNYLKTQKNLMLYYPNEIKEIQNYNNVDNYESLFNVYFNKILKNRNQVKYETYICIYIIDSFYLYKWDGKKIVFVDKVLELLCGEYRDIKSLVFQK